MLAIKNLKKFILVFASTFLLTGCLATTPKDSDPIASLNPPKSELVLYEQYGVNTVGDFKAVVLEMKETGYISGQSSYREMFVYLEDRETADKTPGLTATQVKQQRTEAEKLRIEKKLEAEQKSLDLLFNAKWSIDEFDCDLGGGTYMEFGKQYRVGMRTLIRGRIYDTDQRTSKKFTVNDDGSITLSETIFAQGNALMTDLLGSPDAVVARGTMTYKIQGNKLYGQGTIDRLRSEQLGKTKNPGFTTSPERIESTRCPD